ncbi:hypothetical protein ACXHXM_34155
MVSPVTTVVLGIAGKQTYKWTNSPAAVSAEGSSVKVNGAAATWTASGDEVVISSPTIANGDKIELISTAAVPGLQQNAVPVRKTYT